MKPEQQETRKETTDDTDRTDNGLGSGRRGDLVSAASPKRSFFNHEWTTAYTRYGVASE